MPPDPKLPPPDPDPERMPPGPLNPPSLPDPISPGPDVIGTGHGLREIVKSFLARWFDREVGEQD